MNNLSAQPNLSLYDVLVLGGGINGVGIAMDAAGRGLKVALCEMQDLGGATSSSSSKLIHGGLRYLEYYEFGLVQKALHERERLLTNAPHIMWPLRFRLPHQSHLRPAWLIRLGLFFYDNLAPHTHLAGSRSVRFTKQSPLQAQFIKGFEYSDGWVDDARLVILCAKAAQQQGAAILPRQRCVKAERQQQTWLITLEHTITGERTQLRSKTLVNATGPWASQIFENVLPDLTTPQQLRLVKGSHIVVPRLHDGDEAYLLQNKDGRIVFVLPFHQQFSLIGTTDVDYEGDASHAAISEQEIAYLCRVVNGYFKRSISAHDIVWTYAGVRPLIAGSKGSAQQASRDYHLELDAPSGQAPLLSIFGGKLTTYRLLAEQATTRLARFFPQAGPTWTHHAVLPGGHFSTHTQLNQALAQDYPWLSAPLRQRYVQSYGTLCHQFLASAQNLADLGRHFGAGLYQAEVDYLVAQEWAHTTDDILWRRTKLGLVINPAQTAALSAYLASMDLKHFST